MTLQKESLRDVAQIGGKTLLEHTHNIRRRLGDLSNETDTLALAIQAKVFGPEPRATDEENVKPYPFADTADGMLSDIDRSLNVLSDAVEQLRRIVSRLGISENGDVVGAAPPRAYEATRDASAPSRQRY